MHFPGLLLGVGVLLGGAVLLSLGPGPVVTRTATPAVAPPGTPAVTRTAALDTVVAAEEGAQVDGDEAELGPGPAPVDRFHPDGDVPAEPAYGGSVTVHLRDRPQHLNYALRNWTSTRWVLLELHEWLVQRDFETWEFRPNLAERWDVEDSLLLAPGAEVPGAFVPERGGPPRLCGRVTDAGDAWRCEPVAAGNPLAGPVEVPKAQVASVQRGTVTTFHLREGVLWHDGHPFDADDVLFSWRLYLNPEVDCDARRGQFEKIVDGRVIDAHTVRFVYAEQYFGVLESFDSLCILPRHLYDLTDPDHPQYDPDASQTARAREINENQHNTDWVGLGPYRLTRFDDDLISAERFDDYFDPAHGGFFDVVRWRPIPSTDTAFQALLNGELDFFYSLSSTQYFGAETSSEAFTRRLYKGYFYTGAFNYTPFNLLRPKLQDLRVRKAIVQGFDLEGYRRTVANGLAVLPTGSQMYFGPAYARDVLPLPHDPERARELLAEAGWYDRDGDGIVDRDGVPLALEMLSQAGNKAGDLFVQAFQEDMARIGIRIDVTLLDRATYAERLRSKDFDLASGSWTIDPENDPEQLWHSRGAAPEHRGSNHASVADPHVDELIERGERELDDQKRWAIWRELHRYLYEEVMPYLFRLAPPTKFAMNKAIRGMQCFHVSPGFSIRRWYYPAGTPGTRPTREK